MDRWTKQKVQGRLSRMPRRARGVALIEALVALLVMAFGMVAVAGLMGTMRRSADLAKQRGEALRIAQQEMEQLRDYSVLALDPLHPVPRQRDFTTDIPVDATTVPAGGDLNSNTSYSMSRTVTDLADPPAKAINVAITWKDRADESQFLITDSFIAKADPTLSTSLSIAPNYSSTQRPPDGNSTIPPGAKDVGGGRSALIPGANGTVALVFNNYTGVVTSQCNVTAGTTTQSLTGSVLTDCSPLIGVPVWGYVRFANASPLNLANLGASLATSYAQPLMMSIAGSGVSGAQSPPSPTCFDNAPATAAIGATLTQTSVAYICVVPLSNFEISPAVGSTPAVTVNSWTGKLNVGGISTSAGASKICRYSGNYDGNASISNNEHPLIYNLVQGALGSQNFLVIKESESCPTGATGATGEAFYKTATVPHQPTGEETPTTVH